VPEPYAVPHRVANWIGGREVPAADSRVFDKLDPASGRLLTRAARSGRVDAEAAIAAARAALPAWRSLTPVARGNHLREIAIALQRQSAEFASIVALETGKSVRDATGEVGAAVEMGFFVAGEGRRFNGRTTTSAVPNKAAMVVRQPLGVAGLIIAANTPIANVAWKVFPALLCGNTAVLKAAEDTPITAWAFAKLAQSVGLPDGVLNVLQGYGPEAGAPLVESHGVDVVSFTGSCAVGRMIARTAGERLAKVCLELGGKNPLIVCDDAEIALAVEAAAQSAFSNAGQRCASGSRLIVFDAVYEEFRDRLAARARSMKVGSDDACDFGPVINERQLSNMVSALERARQRGAQILCGGHRLTDPEHAGGFYMAATVVEGVAPDDEISTTELFGPITLLYRVRDFDEAVRLANQSPFGLTASIHTRNLHRAMEFLQRIESGVAVVNGPTYGSEPHMPFGGLRQSGNGMREAGSEALDVYSDWKTIYVNHTPGSV
jgi:aldehyde dehydrogenase (NAD+)